MAREICPACSAARVDRGPASGLQYSAGAWIGCTSCGLSLSGPDPQILEAAWLSICRSTGVRDLRQAPAPIDPEADFPF